MFKRVFGSEECKDILIGFLNDVIKGPDIIDVAEFANFTAEQMESYLNAEQMKYDYQNTIDYAEKKGKIDTARNLANLGVDMDTISKATGISADELAEILKQEQK